MTYFSTISAKGRAGFFLPPTWNLLPQPGQVPIGLARVGVRTVSMVGGGCMSSLDFLADSRARHLAIVSSRVSSRIWSSS